MKNKLHWSDWIIKIKFNKSSNHFVPLVYKLNTFKIFIQKVQNACECISEISWACDISNVLDDFISCKRYVYKFDARK